jgi:ribosomal protein L31
VIAIVNEASQLRSTSSTLQNDVSSRSHTVFTLSVVQQRDVRKPVTGKEY